MKRPIQILLSLIIATLVIIACTKKDSPPDPPPTPTTYTLTTSSNPTNGGTISPASGTFNKGQTVTLTAIPSTNYEFKNWSGGAAGTTNPVTVTMSSNLAVTAVFEELPVIYENGEGVIGSTGGIVTVTDANSSIKGAFVQIPEGAVSSDITVSIKQASATEEAPTDENAIIIEFSPEGTVFEKQVKIGLPYNSNTDVTKLKAFYYNLDSAKVVSLPIDSIDLVNKIAITSTNHFSKFYAGESNVGADIQMYNNNGKFYATIRLFGEKNGQDKGIYGIPFYFGSRYGWLYPNIGQLIEEERNYHPYSVFTASLWKRSRSLWINFDTQVDECHLWVFKSGSTDGFLEGFIVYEKKDGALSYVYDAFLNPNISSFPDKLNTWFSGKALVFKFENFEPETNQEYFVKVGWALSDEPEARRTNTATIHYWLENYREKKKIGQLSTFSGDDDNNYIQDQYQENILPPSVPTLSSPSNNSTDIETSTTLSWNASERATSYSLQVSTNNSFSNTVVNQDGLTSTNYNVSDLNNSTNYYWRVKATNDNGSSDWSDVWLFTTADPAKTLPSVTTSSITNITQTTATCGGNISSDGNAVVTVRGVCWSTSENPEITDYKTSDGTGTGEFTSNITGLTPNTTYYVSAYATNSEGTAYGESKQFLTENGGVSTGFFTDSRDDNTYATVEISNQVWMAENLAYLPAVYPSSSWSNTEPHYHVYDYNGTSISSAKATANYTTYGVLYNWPAAMAGTSSSDSNPSGVQGVCPSGWHLPSDQEWKTLEMALGMSESEANDIGWRGTDEGRQMKSTSGWSSLGNGTNSSGFNAYPGGIQNSGSFSSLGHGGFWWSTTEREDSNTDAWFRLLPYESDQVYRSDVSKTRSNSVRCIKSSTSIETEDPPIANFNGSPRSGTAPLTVSFTDLSTNSPTSWQWDFGDGNTSTDKSPNHIYTSAGSYTVSLTVSNAYGSDTETKTNHITVSSVNSGTGTFTDARDGKTYKTVEIGSQTWFAENLNYETTNSWWYENSSANGDIYGRLYTWEAAKEACPSGWHLPSDDEWTELSNYLAINGYGYGGSGSDIGKSMASTLGWNSSSDLGDIGNDQSTNNSSGFSALPGGYRANNDHFYYLGGRGYWWSATVYFSPLVWHRRLGYGGDAVYRGNYHEGSGSSVRCVRD